VRVLIVEDEEHLALGLKFNFEAEGYQVDVASEGKRALAILAQADPPVDLVVLDLMLPGMSGYEICEAIRLENHDLPIMVLSARTLSEDKARAFDLGVDQYVTKPFNLPEVLSRVRNLAKRRPVSRRPSVEIETVEFGRAKIDFRRYEAFFDGEPRKLTPMEMKLLQLFVRHEGAVLSRREILAKVWDMNPAPETRTVDNFILRLRKHFEIDPAHPRHFQSVRGAGYRFLADPGPVTSEED
jgi:two-component system OmpR family response regulator